MKNVNKLTFKERQMIEFYLRLNLSARAMAPWLGRHHGTVSLEISRNSGDYLPYSAIRAQEIADRRKRKSHQRKLDKYPELKEYIAYQLQEGLSPEQISGRLVNNPPLCLVGITVSHESIYQYIYNGTGKYLYKYLRKKRFKRRKHCSRKKSEKTLIKEAVSIHCRDKETLGRERLGDWESDTMVFSKQKEGLSVQFERKSKLVRINRIANRSSKETYNALLNTIESLPKDLFKTMTFDNGGEGACHRDIRKEHSIKTYFCDPFCSWQKGGVENTNGLIRQYLPRKTKLNTLTDRDIYLIQEKLNNRPRKALNYKTPNEVIKQYLEEGVAIDY